MKNIKKYTHPSKMQIFSNLSSVLFGAIATLAIASCELLLPFQSLQATEKITIKTKQKQTKQRVVKIAGNYKTVFTPKFLDDAKKAGIQSLMGQWTIKPNGEFEAIVKSISVSGAVQTIKTTGRVSIKNGKVVSQVEAINGKKTTSTFLTQVYTLLEDEKTLQADGQPVKLVRQ